MAILNMTTFDAALKELYQGQVVADLIYKKNPLLALLPKMENFVGRNYPLPVVYGTPQNRSATASTAIAGTTSSLVDQWLLTRVKNYSVAQVDGETMRISKSDKGAFMSAVEFELDKAFQALANDIAFGIARDSSGYRGQVNAEPTEASTTVITLKEPEDVVGFEVGQTIVIHSAKSGGSARIYATSVSSGLISAVDRDAGTITINVAYDSNGTIAANDYLFVSGDRGLKMTGLEDWIPDSAPTTSLFGVDRTVDTTKLGGVRHTGTSSTIEEALIDGARKIASHGGAPDYCFMNFNQFGKLIKELQSRVSYVNVNAADAGVGFRGIEIHGGANSMVVVPDRTIRDSRAYMLQLDTWKLCSAGPLAQILDEDAHMLRSSTADSYELRVGSFAQLGCMAPGHNGVVTLA